MCRTFAIFVIIGGLLGAPVGIVSAASLSEGGNAPDFVLKSAGGDNLRLSEHRGEVVMINFWATWCGPCRQEISHLNGLYERYRNTGFMLFGVNIDEDPHNAKRLAGSLGVSYPVLFDEAKTVSRLYQVDAMPSTVLVDRDGVVRYVHRGYRPGYENAYRDQVRDLLKE